MDGTDFSESHSIWLFHLIVTGILDSSYRDQLSRIVLHDILTNLTGFEQTTSVFLVLRLCCGGPWFASGQLIPIPHICSCDVNGWWSTERFSVSSRNLRGEVQRAITSSCITSFTELFFSFLSLSLSSSLLLSASTQEEEEEAFIHTTIAYISLPVLRCIEGLVQSKSKARHWWLTTEWPSVA